MSQHNDGNPGVDKLIEDKIKAQQCPKSTFVPFRNMVSQRHPIRSTPRPTPIKDLSKAEMRARREKDFVIIVMGNSPKDINALNKSSISWMWFLHMHLKFLKLLRI